MYAAGGGEVEEHRLCAEHNGGASTRHRQRQQDPEAATCCGKHSRPARPAIIVLSCGPHAVAVCVAARVRHLGAAGSVQRRDFWAPPRCARRGLHACALEHAFPCITPATRLTCACVRQLMKCVTCSGHAVQPFLTGSGVSSALGYAKPEGAGARSPLGALAALALCSASAHPSPSAPDAGHLACVCTRRQFSVPSSTFPIS